MASFGIELETEPPAKPSLDVIDADEMASIDVGILKYAHDIDGTAVESLDRSADRERLDRERQKLSRKDHGSTNWEKQRQKVAESHQRIKRKQRDFLHKLSTYYACEYDLVAVEALDVKVMLESPGNSRNTALVAWATFTSMLESKCEREGTHVVEVNPEGTTKECAQWGVETDKPLWVCEQSCPACGCEADRDANAAWNILSRGFSGLGVGYSEGTPVETALPADTAVVSAQRVMEAGSPTLSEHSARAGWGSL